MNIKVFANLRVKIPLGGEDIVTRICDACGWSRVLLNTNTWFWKGKSGWSLLVLDVCCRQSRRIALVRFCSILLWTDYPAAVGASGREAEATRGERSCCGEGPSRRSRYPSQLGLVFRIFLPSACAVIRSCLDFRGNWTIIAYRLIPMWIPSSLLLSFWGLVFSVFLLILGLPIGRDLGHLPLPKV